MQDVETPALIYSVDHARFAIVIRLTEALLVVETHGKALLDKPKKFEIPLADLLLFAVVPTAPIQNVVGGSKPHQQIDNSYDAELLLAANNNGVREKHRVFVDSQSAAFCEILTTLTNRRPDASLLGIGTDEAYRRIGVLGPSQAVWIVVGVLVGLPILGTIIMLLVAYLKGSLK
ncbi:MAG: hypothetical protein ACKVX7_09885 [Planctomycetota bacterium]